HPGAKPRGRGHDLPDHSAGVTVAIKTVGTSASVLPKWHHCRGGSRRTARMAAKWRFRPGWGRDGGRGFPAVCKLGEVGIRVEVPWGVELMANDPAPPPAAGTPTVLVVDDEPGIVDSLQKILERESLRVLTAGSGGEALDIVRREGVSVLI